MRNIVLIALAVTALVSATVAGAATSYDFGWHRDNDLANLSYKLYGVGTPVAKSSTKQLTQAQARTDPTKLVTLAKGLHARVVTTDGPPNDDQITLWPNDRDPTYLIACNESDSSDPGVVRISLATGAVSTIVSGTDDCDPTRITPWGTVLFGEEAGGGPDGGRLYELIDPLHTTGVTLDRDTGTFSGGAGAQNLVTRTALGRAAFEGIGILPDGTTYLDYDDSDVPNNGDPGDVFFKFVPAHPFTGSAPITDLSQSPFASGDVFGLRVGLDESFGQGREFGMGTWVPVPHAADPDLEGSVKALGLTGYYRAEDADLDPAALQQGNVRLCSPNTGDEEHHLYGQVVCITDGTLQQAQANIATPEVEPFVIGGTSEGINMPDNIDFQPRRHNIVLNEDAETEFEGPHNNDLWDCLPDGADQDLLTDGCIRIGTLNDLTAEWTGGIFDATGLRYFVSVQHNISGKAAVLEITGWK